jgi:hypothetical protein
MVILELSFFATSNAFRNARLEKLVASYGTRIFLKTMCNVLLICVKNRAYIFRYDNFELV